MAYVDLVWSLTVPALALIGWPAVALFRRRFALDGRTAVAASFAVALLFCQAGAMLLGFLGLLRAWAVIAWTATGFVLASGIAWRTRKAPALPAPPLRFDLAAGATMLLFVPYLLAATVPPWYRDELVYHLALPRLFAMAGGFVVTDDNMYASMPLGWESLLAALHALGAAPDRFPPFNPRAFGAWTTFAASLSCVGLARATGVGERLARWTPVLFLLTPTVFEFGSSAYVEPYLLLLTTLALTAVLRSEEGDAFLPLAGAFAGAACSVKYPALALALFCAIVLLMARARVSGRFSGYRALGLFCLAAAPFALPFLVRNLVERGNPVFPFFFDAFGGRGWDEWRSWGYSTFLSRFGAGHTLADWLALPWRTFTWRDLSSGFEGSLGPVPGLGALASGFWALRARGPARVTAVFALVWAVFWALSTQQLRFFLVAVPALLALLLLTLEKLRRQPLFLALVIAGAAVWTLPPAAQVWNRQRTTEWLAGRIDRKALLDEQVFMHRIEPDLEALVPPEGRIWLVWMSNHTYYLRRDSKQDSVFEAYRLEALLDEAGDDATLLRSLRSERISHLLVDGGLFLNGDNADLWPGRTAKLRTRFDALVASGALSPLRRWGRATLYEVSRRD
ncbi:MAG: phospholipid carrier-dependent glycosyltransferase [Myxococcales bacterium]